MRIVGISRRVVRVGLLGVVVGLGVAGILAPLRVAAGTESLTVDEFGLRECVEIGLATPVVEVWERLYDDGQTIAKACAKAIVLNGLIYGLIAFVIAWAGSWRRWAGVVLAVPVGLWILFWLVVGALGPVHGK